MYAELAEYDITTDISLLPSEDNHVQTGSFVTLGEEIFSQEVNANWYATIAIKKSS